MHSGKTGKRLDLIFEGGLQGCMKLYCMHVNSNTHPLRINNTTGEAELNKDENMQIS